MERAAEKHVAKPVHKVSVSPSPRALKTPKSKEDLRPAHTPVRPGLPSKRPGAPLVSAVQGTKRPLPGSVSPGAPSPPARPQPLMRAPSPKGKRPMQVASQPQRVWVRRIPIDVPKVAPKTSPPLPKSSSTVKPVPKGPPAKTS